MLYLTKQRCQWPSVWGSDLGSEFDPKVGFTFCVLCFVFSKSSLLTLKKFPLINPNFYAKKLGLINGCFYTPGFGRMALGVGVGMPFHSLQNPEKPASVLGQPHHPLVFSPGATMNTDPSRSTRKNAIRAYTVLRLAYWVNGPRGYEVNE